MKKLDRNQIEKTISSLVSDERHRKICLSLFVESLLEANSHGSNKWGVYCYNKGPQRRGVRLLVGGLIVFTIHKDELWISLDKQLLDERKDAQKLLETSEAWNWDRHDYPEYDRVPSRNGFYVPSSDNQDIWPVIRDLHFEHIKKTANAWNQLRGPSQRNHNPELLAYISNELGQSIPNPDYSVTL